MAFTKPELMKEEKALNQRQAKFVEAYKQNGGDRIAAYMEVYNVERGAARAASFRLLKHPSVAKAINGDGSNYKSVVKNIEKSALGNPPKTARGKFVNLQDMQEPLKKGEPENSLIPVPATKDVKGKTREAPPHWIAPPTKRQAL